MWEISFSSSSSFITFPSPYNSYLHSLPVFSYQNISMCDTVSGRDGVWSCLKMWRSRSGMMVVETWTQRARGPVRYREIGRRSRMRDTSWDHESKVVVTEFREVVKDVEPALQCSKGFRSLEVTFRAGRFACWVVHRRDIDWVHYRHQDRGCCDRRGDGGDSSGWVISGGLFFQGWDWWGWTWRGSGKSRRLLCQTILTLHITSTFVKD